MTLAATCRSHGCISLVNIMKQAIRTFQACLSLAVLMTLPFAAHAQQGEGIIEEIIVTANKRAESSQYVASAITAISSADVERGGIVDITRLEGYVPGLRIGVSGGEVRPALRGARTNEVGVAGTGIAEQVVGIFHDGVYVPSTTSGLGAFLDVERIEVLRGPQGTLYGRNTFAGTINVVTKKPEFGDQVTGSIKGTFGDYSRYAVEGLLNIPFGTEAALRLVYAQDQHDGLINNLDNTVSNNDLRDKDESYGRVAFSWDPAGPFSLDARIDVMSRDALGDAIWGYQQIAGYQLTPVLNDNGIFTGRYQPVVTPQEGHIYQPANATRQDRGPYEVYRNSRSVNTQDSQAATLNVGWEFDSFDLKVIANYNRTEGDQFYDNDYSDGGPDVVGGFGRRDDQTSTSVEVQLISGEGDSRLDWVAGLYYSTFEAKWAWLWRDTGNNTIIVPSWGAAGLSDPHATDTEALFGQMTWNFSDSSRLTVGARYNSDDKEITEDTGEGSDLTPTTWSDNNLTWKAFWEWDITENSLFYAGGATGVRTGGVNERRAVSRGAPATYESEEVMSYEVGWKNLWLNGTFQLNLALFQNIYEDSKAQLFAFGCSDANLDVANCLAADDNNTLLTFEYYENGGDIETRGAELDLRWLILNSLELTATAAWVESEFDSFRVGNSALRPLIGLGNISGRQNVNDNEDPTFNFSGYRPALSPAYQASVGVSYSIRLGNSTLTPSVNTTLVDDYYAFDVNIPEVLQPSHYIIDARLTWATDGGLEVDLFALNINDEAVITRAVVHSQRADVTVNEVLVKGVPLNSVQVNYNNPRTYGASIRYRF